MAFNPYTSWNYGAYDPGVVSKPTSNLKPVTQNTAVPKPPTLLTYQAPAKVTAKR